MRPTAFLAALLAVAGCAADPAPALDRAAAAAEWRAWMAARDSLFRSPATPLPPEDAAAFDGLDYFSYDSTMALPAALVPSLGRDTVLFPTTTGALQRYATAGELVFERDGVKWRLKAFEPLDVPTGGTTRLFVPFRDATTGQSTYGGGRYLDLASDGEALVALDLNRAYHPYCVYDPSYSCPLPPAENRLAFAVTAGERLPAGYGVRQPGDANAPAPAEAEAGAEGTER